MRLLHFREGEIIFYNITMETEEVMKYWKIYGIVIPGDATITIIPESDEDLNRTTGHFTISGIENGYYELIFEKDGYLPQVVDVVIDGSDYYVGTITLLLEEPNTYSVIIGPFHDENADGIPGITVSFKINGIEYMEYTGSDGRAVFELPTHTIPYGTKITTEYIGETREWTYSDINYNFFDVDDNYATIGPIKDANGKRISSCIVSFPYYNQTYTAETDENGIATFYDFPLLEIPAGVVITARKGDEVMTWEQGDTIPTFKGGKEERFPTWMIILIIVGVIVITAAIVVIIVLVKKRSGGHEDESPYYQEQEVKYDLGEDCDTEIIASPDERIDGRESGDLKVKEFEGTTEIPSTEENLSEEGDAEPDERMPICPPHEHPPPEWDDHDDGSEPYYPPPGDNRYDDGRGRDYPPPQRDVQYDQRHMGDYPPPRRDDLYYDRRGTDDLSILKKRLVRGEITKQEYEDLKRVIEE